MYATTKAPAMTVSVAVIVGIVDRTVLSLVAPVPPNAHLEPLGPRVGVYVQEGARLPALVMGCAQMVPLGRVLAPVTWATGDQLAQTLAH